MKKFCLGLLLMVVPMVASADARLDEFATRLTEPNRVYGSAVTAKELAGRVVLIWNISSYVQTESDDNNDDDNDWNNRRNNKDEEDASPEGQMKARVRAIRKAAKGALKDGRLLVIAVDEMPQDPDERRRRTAGVRKLKPPFPVYDSNVKTQLFNVEGAYQIEVNDVSDLTDGSRLKDCIEAAADYIPGRMILYRTKSHESQSKQFVEGKLIEKPYAQLAREANGKGEKAEEAKRMHETVTAYIEKMCADIEAALTSAPSLAVEKILVLQKTLPAAARKYQRAIGPLRNNADVKQLIAVRNFLQAANAGDVGRGDMGRAADGYVKKLKVMSQSKNAAVATEATTFLTQLEPLTSEALAKADQEMKALRTANRKRLEEERKEQKLAEKNAKRGGTKDDDSRGNSTRPTAYSVLSPSGSSGFEIFKDELLRLDDATCNYESLRNSYTKYEEQKGEKAEAAKALIGLIDATRDGYLEALKTIQANQTPFALFEKDWENLITVNYPSVGSQPVGRAALKTLRDSEVKRIYGALDDYRNGKPEQGEDEYHEEYEIRCTQYKIAKLKNLQKYRKTGSTLGKACVAHLDALGFTDKDILAKIEEHNTSVKEQKKAQKEAEKQRKKNERDNN